MGLKVIRREGEAFTCRLNKDMPAGTIVHIRCLHVSKNSVSLMVEAPLEITVNRDEIENGLVKLNPYK